MTRIKKRRHEKDRRLSLFRLFLLCMILAGLTTGGILAATGHVNQMGNWLFTESAKHDKLNPWFAPYVDVTATPIYMFQNPEFSEHKDVVLAFIVSDLENACTPSWGGAYTLDQAAETLDLDRRIARLQQQGGSVAISFGGANNDELAVGCKDVDELMSAYETIVDRYHVKTIDLDLENTGLTNVAAGIRRAAAIAKLQSERRSVGKPLAVWVTLPVSPQGLTSDGMQAIEILLNHGVDLAGVNLMTMNYGLNLSKDSELETMQSATENALIQTQRQLKSIYRQAGIYLSDETLWSKIGATPMIGQNDFKKEVFTLDDAKALNAFAHAHGVGRMSMWSANRDKMCGSNYADVSIVSDACSGVNQSNFSFTELLSMGYQGSIDTSAGLVTSDFVIGSPQIPDDPETSPYPIWSEDVVYLEGEKVVRNHHVYQAKWWTKGDVPDDPLVQSWETPWNLLGPVLPGEKPIQQPTLPEGIYPSWSRMAEYEPGERVIFRDVPYEAKWWTRGENPSLALLDAESAAWAPLTQEQINDIAVALEKTEVGKDVELSNVVQLGEDEELEEVEEELEEETEELEEVINENEEVED